MKRALHKTSITIAIAIGLVVPTFAATAEAHTPSPVVGMAATPGGAGEWIARADGTVTTVGDARALGSVRQHLNQPIAGITATPSGRGYWLVAADGGIFSFGDAAFHGSTGALRLNQPITGMASTPSGRGYWLLASDGGIFPFGDARFAGSAGSIPLHGAMVGMAATTTGRGYWLVAADGGVFSFGDAPFLGSGRGLAGAVVGIAARRSGGYRVVSDAGRTIDLTARRTAVPPSTQTGTTSTTDALPFPGPGTVGHLADLPGHNVPATNLTAHDGDFTTTHDGEVVEAMDITGSVVVRNRDVIVRRNRIGLGVRAIPDAAHRSVSARVEWNTIGPEHGYEGEYLFGNGRGENLVFYRNEIFGGVDLFNFYDSGNITIQENWAYGAYQELSDRYQLDQTPTTSHSDGIQVHMGGAHYHVIRNRFDLFLFRGYRWSGAPNKSAQEPLTPRPSAKDQLGIIPNIAPMTTGFLFQQTNGRLDDVLFDGNRVDGDFYRALSFEKGPYTQSATNVRIVNNTFVRRYPNFGRNQLVGADTYSNITFDNNVDETGRSIPVALGMKGAA